MVGGGARRLKPTQVDFENAGRQRESQVGVSRAPLVEAVAVAVGPVALVVAQGMVAGCIDPEHPGGAGGIDLLGQLMRPVMRPAENPQRHHRDPEASGADVGDSIADFHFRSGRNLLNVGSGGHVTHDDGHCVTV